jgi:hypothetical protein
VIDQATIIEQMSYIMTCSRIVARGAHGRCMTAVNDQIYSAARAIGGLNTANAFGAAKM